MTLGRTANQRSASGATILVILGLFPLWYGALIAYARFPAVPSNLFFLYLLGLPGIWIVGSLEEHFGMLNFATSLLLAALITWAFYFAMFRLFYPFRVLQKAKTEVDSRAQEGPSENA